MKLLIVSLTLLSLNVFADHGVCLTQGDCLNHSAPQESTKCFIIKTGQSPDGNTTCALRCYTVTLGNICHIAEGDAFGTCMKEPATDMPVFDERDPNRCETALNPLQF
jgi:hypothetical protein